jgi:nucleotidyltransferase/DNA polymerase involved in DNA repair
MKAPEAAPTPRTILHVDMDAFYAAVEVRENPALQGKPVVVGADPKRGSGRGVVATCNYEARRYGIGSAMPISEAWRRCPHAVYVTPRMSLYAGISNRIFDLMRGYTDAVEPISIDEAWLDVTASDRLFGDGPSIARSLKRDIREAEGLSASVGVAGSKFVAKVASDLDKPDGLVIVEPGKGREFLDPLDIERLWGAGPKALEKFRRLNCRTIGDVARLDPGLLKQKFGEAMGTRFARLSRGLDTRAVTSEHVRKSLGKERTFGEDVSDRAYVEKRLLELCEGVSTSLRRKGLAGETVTIKLRWEGFETVTRQRTLDRPANTSAVIWPVARALLHAADRPERRVRLIGVTLSKLDTVRMDQLSLFRAKHEVVDARVTDAVDRITKKFGKRAVVRAALLPDPGSDRLPDTGSEAK